MRHAALCKYSEVKQNDLGLCVVQSESRPESRGGGVDWVEKATHTSSFQGEVEPVTGHLYMDVLINSYLCSCLICVCQLCDLYRWRHDCVCLQLDSNAQNELKEGMKIYESEPGLQKSWDNVQKMVRAPSPPWVLLFNTHILVLSY